MPYLVIRNYIIREWYSLDASDNKRENYIMTSSLC